MIVLEYSIVCLLLTKIKNKIKIRGWIIPSGICVIMKNMEGEYVFSKKDHLGYLVYLTFVSTTHILAVTTFTVMFYHIFASRSGILEKCVLDLEEFLDMIERKSPALWVGMSDWFDAQCLFSCQIYIVVLEIKTVF